MARLGIAITLATGLIGLTAPAVASANDIQVTTEADNLAADSICSLREAITAARTDGPFGGCSPGSGTDRVLVGTGHFTLVQDGSADNNNASGDLDIANLGMTVNHVTIVGDGAAKTIVDASGLAHRDRVFDIQPGADAQIQGLKVIGGHAPDGAPGADVSGVPGNPGMGADGGSGLPGAAGGGILNRGTLTLQDVTVEQNLAGHGGHGGSGTGGGGTGCACDAGNGFGGIGGTGGDGGGVANLGTLTVRDSAIVGNAAGEGGAGGNGTGGQGGVVGNNAGKGGLGQGLGGGTGGWGGGIANAGTLTVERTLVAGDGAGSGGLGGSGQGGAGGSASASSGDGIGAPGGHGGWGGGIAELDVFPFPHTEVSASAFIQDGSGSGGEGGNAHRGGSAAVESAGGGGDAGPGGGLMFLDGQTASVQNVTLAQNGTGFGGFGGFDLSVGGVGSTGLDGDGYAVASRNHSLTLTHDTIAGAFPPDVPTLANGGRGIVAVLLGTTTFTNSIVVGDCFVNANTTLTDGGNDVKFNGSGCPGSTGDPKLGDLGDNGGPTPTLALQPGSAAIDIVPASGAGCLPADQRGIARPQIAACDSGAFELTPAPVSSAAGPGPGGGTPPAVSGVSADPPTFAVGSAPTPVLLRAAARRRAVHQGTTIGFTLSEAANVSIAFARRGAGLKLKPKKGGKARCVAATKRNRRALLAQVKRRLGRGAAGAAGAARIRRALKKARCVRYAKAGALQRAGVAGPNRVKFSGRVGTKALRLGRYRVRVTGTDAAGLRSKPADGAFRVVAGSKKKSG